MPASSVSSAENPNQIRIQKRQGYLHRCVGEKKKTGEGNFQDLYMCWLADMAVCTADINHMVFFSTLILGFMRHNSTYTPIAGHGKAQARESNMLQYYRSQGRHPDVRLHNDLTAQKGSKKSRLPMNPEFLALLNSYTEVSNVTRILNQFDELGYPKISASVGSYDSLQIAHSGARVNNFLVILDDLLYLIREQDSETAKSILLERIKKVLPLTKEIKRMQPTDSAACIQELLQQFNDMTSTLPRAYHRTSTILHAYRLDRIKLLENKLLELEYPLSHIQIVGLNGSTCLMLKLYSNSFRKNDKKRETSLYSEGVTNFILCFFAALINQLATKKGLSLRVTLRQSFGFLRPTITDAGSMCLRLSLGVEPKLFDSIIFEALIIMDEVLEYFNFVNLQHPLVEEAFANAPSKQQARIHNIVSSDGLKLDTWYQAEAYLAKASAKPGNNNGYVITAMRDFLSNYVINNIKVQFITVPKLPDAVVNKGGASATWLLLKNILRYAIQRAAKFEYLNEQDPLYSFSQSIYHVLYKLLNNCQKAQELLAHRKELETSHFYAKASLLIENILEYLVVLNGLIQIREQIQLKQDNSIDKLKETELNAAARESAIDRQKLDIFYTDGGQQAVIASMLVMSEMLQGEELDKIKPGDGIHIMPGSYYEINSFMDDIKATGRQNLLASNLSTARIIFIDATQIANINLEQCPALMSLIIDNTHHDSVRSEVKKLINEAHAKGIWTVLVTSMIKHGQLGMDNRQLGRIITIEPENDLGLIEVNKIQVAKQWLQRISDRAMHPATASFMQMINKICGDKLIQPKHTVSSKGAWIARLVAKKAGVISVPRYRGSLSTLFRRMRVTSPIASVESLRNTASSGT